MRPKLTVDEADSFVLHVIVAVVVAVDDAMEEMIGGVISGTEEVVKV